MNNNRMRTKVEISQNNRVTYEEKTALFGLVRWWLKVCAEKLSDDLVIWTDIKIENIYINGEKMKKSHD